MFRQLSDRLLSLSNLLDMSPTLPIRLLLPRLAKALALVDIKRSGQTQQPSDPVMRGQKVRLLGHEQHTATGLKIPSMIQHPTMVR
jgi:hypothetical protein